MKWSLRFLETHKQMFGFADYKITISDKTEQENESVASAEPNWLERELKITLYRQYVDRKDKKNTLIHELIHALIARYNLEFEEKTKEAKYFEEEKVVNIITDAVMELMEASK